MKEYILEDKLVDLWPNYPCLFDVRSPDFKNRDKKLKAFEEIAKELKQTSKKSLVLNCLQTEYNVQLQGVSEN